MIFIGGGPLRDTYRAGVRRLVLGMVSAWDKVWGGCSAATEGVGSFKFGGRKKKDHPKV